MPTNKVIFLYRRFIKRTYYHERKKCKHFDFFIPLVKIHTDIGTFLILKLAKSGGRSDLCPFGNVYSAARWYSEGFPPAVEAAAAHCVWEAASRLIRRGERSSNKKLRREDYKYCMAAAILLPEPSYCCYIAHCKNVRSLHCTALNHVEITNYTVRLCFGLELWFGVFWIDMIRKMAYVTMLSVFSPLLVLLLLLSNGF